LTVDAWQHIDNLCDMIERQPATRQQWGYNLAASMIRRNVHGKFGDEQEIADAIETLNAYTWATLGFRDQAADAFFVDLGLASRGFGGFVEYR
jgi:hypothetical protein